MQLTYGRDLVLAIQETLPPEFFESQTGPAEGLEEPAIGLSEPASALDGSQQTDHGL